MNYRINDIPKCKYCQKENKIYKEGYCYTCYRVVLKDKYVLNPNKDFKTPNQKEIVYYFLANPNVSRKEIAKIFKTPLSTVNYTIHRFTIKLKLLK